MEVHFQRRIEPRDVLQVVTTNLLTIIWPTEKICHFELLLKSGQLLMVIGSPSVVDLANVHNPNHGYELG